MDEGADGTSQGVREEEDVGADAPVAPPSVGSMHTDDLESALDLLKVYQTQATTQPSSGRPRQQPPTATATPISQHLDLAATTPAEQFVPASDAAPLPAPSEAPGHTQYAHSAYSRSTLQALIDEGNPPSCAVHVMNGDQSEVLLMEAAAWGQVAVGLETAKGKTGIVTCAAMNPFLRQFYITGPGLPSYGHALHLPKNGFKSSSERLEQTLKASGVPFAPGITLTPDVDSIDLVDLLPRDSAAYLTLPWCSHNTDTVMTFIRRYAEARALRAPETTLRLYRDQLREEGILVDARGDNWTTKDGRKGAIPHETVKGYGPGPWRATQYTELTNIVGAGAEFERGYQREQSSLSRKAKERSVRSAHSLKSHDAPRSSYSLKSHNAPSQTSKSGLSPGNSPRPKRGMSANGRVFGRTVSRETASSARSPKSASARRPHTPPPASHRMAWRPGGASPRPSLASELSLSTHASRPKSRRVTTDHYDITELAADPSCVIGPCVLHIPPGTSVVLSPDPDIKPLSVTLREGGIVRQNTRPASTTYVDL